MWVTTQHREGTAFWFLSWYPVRAIGILSYSIYIWHVLFLCNFTGPSLRALLYDWRTWWLAALAVAATSYVVLERPMLRLKTRLSERADFGVKSKSILAPSESLPLNG